VLGRKETRYLDVGAHDPWFLSNTALFYEKGPSGVCVEPDPTLCRNLRRHRRRDVCLNAGVAPGEGSEADFYVLSASTLSTLSREEAQRRVAEGHTIDAVVRVPLVSVNALLHERFDRCPEFVSIDVEGLDEAVLRSMDFDRFRPDVICVETLLHSAERHLWKKLDATGAFMEDRGYISYADTFINTLFVNRGVW
jgi:FkbM family methyltransferase